MRLYVSKLQLTYSAMPISVVAKYLNSSPEDTETYLKNLIDGGYVNARLDRISSPKETLVLRFFSDLTEGPLAKSEKQQHAELLEQTQRTNKLADQVKAADYRLSLNKDYLEHVKRQTKKAAANAAAGEAMDVSWDDSGEPEEDIMGDLVM